MASASLNFRFQLINVVSSLWNIFSSLVIQMYCDAGIIVSINKGISRDCFISWIASITDRLSIFDNLFE